MSCAFQRIACQREGKFRDFKLYLYLSVNQHSMGAQGL